MYSTMYCGRLFVLQINAAFLPVGDVWLVSRVSFIYSSVFLFSALSCHPQQAALQRYVMFRFFFLWHM